MHGLPPRQGLYDPAYEHDSCGLGFVANIHGARSHGLLAQSLQLLDNLSHRGAAGCDPCTGDGAGITIQLPHALFARDASEAEIDLPSEGEYGVGMCFLPRGIAVQRMCERVVAEIAESEGHPVLGWRAVPCDESQLSDRARPEAPAIRSGRWRGRAHALRAGCRKRVRDRGIVRFARDGIRRASTRRRPREARSRARCERMLPSLG